MSIDIEIIIDGESVPAELNNSDTALAIADALPVEVDFATWGDEIYFPVPVKKGSLVLLHGETVHASYANTSSKSRHAFVLHLVDGSAEWPVENWLQRPEDFPFREMKAVIQN